MQYKIMSNMPTIAQFLLSTESNWRTSQYIDCSCCNKECSERRDFLYTPAADGTPLIVPVSDVEHLFCRTLDKTECLSVITAGCFMSLYEHWLDSMELGNGYCKLLTITHKLNPPEDW